MVGSLIGQYKIVGTIGTGGMGTVYAGEHTLIKRRAAIKVLKPELSQRREIIDRFFNEARAAAAIDHPGVVQTYDFGFFDEGDGLRAYIVMELLDGRSLARALHASGPLPELDALRVFHQVASTLAAIHAAGIIHRDLKPDNIYLLRDPAVIGGLRAKILDFGIAKLGDAFEPSQTDAGGLFGTPLYMAPEQFDGKADERSDVYSLGCVMFEALTGRSPFSGASIAQLVRSHLLQPPPKPSSVSAALGPDIDAVVLGCLEKDPARRFSSMTALVDAIDALVERRDAGSGEAPGHKRADRSPRELPDEPGSRDPQPSSRDPQLPRDPQPWRADVPPTPTLTGVPADPRAPAASAPATSAPAATQAGASAPTSSAHPTVPAYPPPTPAPLPRAVPVQPPPTAPVHAPSTLPMRTPPTLVSDGSPPLAEDEPRTMPPGEEALPSSPPGAETMVLPLDLLFTERTAPAMPQSSSVPRAPHAARRPDPLRSPRSAEPRSTRTPRATGTPQPEVVDRARRELAEVFEAAIPAGFRDAQRFLVEFFGGLFATARRFSDQVVELGTPAIRDLEARAHYVLFLDDIDDEPAGPFGELSTQVFRARVDPLAQQLATLDTPPGSVLIAILAAPQLGQGARETIFALRKERNLFVVPIAASEIRRACETGNARRLLDNRIADLHTVSDPFEVFEGFTDPTRNIGFAAEVADLVRHITAGGRIVSVAGPPGSGKTSVVAMAEYGCDTHSSSRRFVRLSCSELSRFDPDALLAELSERVDRIDADDAGPRLPRGTVPPSEVPGLADMRATILRLGERATGPGALAPGRQARTAAPPGPRPTRPGTAPVRREQLVIVLEDADWLIRLASSSEPDTARRQRARELWRSLAELCSSAGHTVIVTSIRDFQTMDQVPLERPVSVLRVPLRALNRHESDRLVSSLGEPIGFSPTRRALARLHRESGGNVYALRRLCSQVIRAMRERPDFSPLARLEVTPRMVDDAARHIAATGSTFRTHVAIWLDDVERVVLQHVARTRPRSPRGIRRALEGSAEPAQIARALDGLELMGLVESRHGRHRVRVPVFERWIDAHLDAPPRLRDAVRRARTGRIAIGCTVTALLFGAYWTWLRSTRSVTAAERKDLRDCTFALDYPDRVGTDETFELFVYQDCKTAEQHELTIEPVLSSLRIPAPTSDCTASTASCTVLFKPLAGKQAKDVYKVRLRVDGQLAVTPSSDAQPAREVEVSIEKDGFALVRTVGEKTVPAIAFLPLLLSVVLTFHKDMKRHVSRLFRRATRSADAPKL